MPKHACIVFLVLISVVLSVTTVFAADTSMGRNVYAVDDVRINDVKAVDDGKLEIRFETLAETLYYCPGANATQKDDGTELRFVRCLINNKRKVDYPVKDGMLTIPADGKPVFVADGNTRVKIWPKD